MVKSEKEIMEELEKLLERNKEWEKGGEVPRFLQGKIETLYWILGKVRDL